MALPTATVELGIEACQHGANRKVSNLANALPLARHDVLVMADSDIEVAPRYLGDIIADLQQPGVGAVTCLYHGIAGSGLWSRQSALAINSHFLPNVVAALSFRPGAAVLWRHHRARPGRPAADRRPQGVRRLSRGRLCDRRSGASRRLSDRHPGLLDRACLLSNDLRALMAHELRAARTIKSINPLGYCGTIISHPFPLALIGGLMGDSSGVLLAALALACRAVLCLSVEHAFALERQPYWLIPARELLSFAVFVASFFGSTVSWRGFGYRVAADGSLLPNQNRAGL